MIAFLRGRVAFLGPGYVDLDVRDVGYRVHVCDRTHAALNLGDTAFLYTHHHVREDGWALYGFETVEERALFERLVAVSGIGPKLALQVIGATGVSEMVAAILAEDAERLSRLPGIGRKLASRLIVELREKVSDLAPAALHAPGPASRPQGRAEEDAVSALVALGYRLREAEEAVSAVGKGHQSVEETIKAALTYLYAREARTEPLSKP
ncbi:Holliday junction branch migration protein RuvA [Alicyclobacillus sendaiensis]|uniref:Holliday junction branch migration complex subunit RuvA n=1 Tax=Alicyclobacillus sendaiensis PA2 TaxID=3029425 RepID=A0ABT6Y0G1_ALISE|nr:Holliday junction branch migration protein RuvA [Alicyclobacillus sendaiensis]MDI9260552.1 Holliday junction branch migration protein RuvA [Alicyclobacillus sendaiensis PA2]